MCYEKLKIILFLLFLLWFSPIPDMISVYFIKKKRGLK